ncbi:MAG: hypothetical protein ACKOKF_05405, partial [Bacteroidota bacterium]
MKNTNISILSDFTAARILALCFLLLSIASSGQEFIFPLNRDMNIRLGSSLTADTSGFHTSIQPYSYFELDSIMDTDTVLSVLL